MIRTTTRKLLAENKPDPDAERAVKEYHDPTPKPAKKETVSDPTADADNLKIHTTKPIEESLHKLKARRIPHDYPKRPKKGEENAEGENRTVDPAHAGGIGSAPDGGSGKQSWTILPVDWFRKS